jgi:hypothetical protein
MIDEVKELHRTLLSNYPGDYTIAGALLEQARALYEGHSRGNPAVYFQITCWFPALTCARAEEILAAPFTLEDAKLTVAREHGFANWEQVEGLGGRTFDRNFENAADAVVIGDASALKDLLRKHPNLIRAVSDYGHQATLLHYVAANGVESWRQTVPPNAVEITRILIEAGADVEAKANMYGQQYSTMGLLLTSAHPKAAGLTDAIAEVLRSAGASG